MEKKKKPSGYIIPASYFKSKNISDVKIIRPNLASIKSSFPVDEENEITEPIKDVIQKPNPPIPVIQTTQRPSSGLSLNSIRKKKEHQIKLMEVNIKEEDLPNDPFNEEDLLKYWDVFVTKLETDGKYNLAAILQIDTPQLIDIQTIRLEFPNNTNKIEVERQQSELLQYLRKALNNFSISLDIIVNETLEKKYAYTPEDKYEKLVEKNKHIELLRKIFELDL